MTPEWAIGDSVRVRTKKGRSFIGTVQSISAFWPWMYRVMPLSKDSAPSPPWYYPEDWLAPLSDLERLSLLKAKRNPVYTEGDWVIFRTRQGAEYPVHLVQVVRGPHVGGSRSTIWLDLPEWIQEETGHKSPYLALTEEIRPVSALERLAWLKKRAKDNPASWLEEGVYAFLDTPSQKQYGRILEVSEDAKYAAFSGVYNKLQLGTAQTVQTAHLRPLTDLESDQDIYDLLPSVMYYHNHTQEKVVLTVGQVVKYIDVVNKTRSLAKIEFIKGRLRASVRVYAHRLSPSMLLMPLSPTRFEPLTALEELAQIKAKDNPTRRWDFTPSYEASSKEEYQKKVKEGDKRNLHVVVEGGRTAARYEEPTDNETRETRTRRLRRWAGQDPPWDARTQALAVREVTSLALRPASRVQRAVETLRAQQPMGAVGFLVPSTIVPLVQAGFTKKEAEILLDRAQGRFFLALEDQTVLSSFPLSDLLTLFMKVVTERISITRDHEIMLVGRGARRGPVLRGFGLVEGKGRKPTPIITSRQLKEMYRINKEAVTTTQGRPYGDDGRDDANYLKAVLSVVRRFILPRLKGKQAKDLYIALLIGSREGKEVRYLPVGEHFVSTQLGALTPEIQYRTLKNVSLASLPDLLVSLSRRKKRKGRRLSRIIP